MIIDEGRDYWEETPVAFALSINLSEVRCMGSMWDANQLAFPLILSLVNQNFKKETNFLSLNSIFYKGQQ